MNDILYIAWRYLIYFRGKTLVLIASISLILFIPAGLNVMVRQTADSLTARAESTPLLIGTKGSAVDLTLSALYFRDPVLDPIKFNQVTRVQESELALPIPLHLRYSASGHRIVGTTLDYFNFRGLRIERGRAMAVLGECVLGYKAARVLGAAPGAYVLSSPAGAFDVAGSFPLKMKVVGTLSPSGMPDDDAVFVDLKTAWVIAGLAHGHMDMTKPEAEQGVLRREGSNVVANASVLSYTEITEENIDSFHFHGDPAEFPVDAVIIVPQDRKSEIVLRGRYQGGEEPVQMLVPRKVMDELLETILTVRDYVVVASLAVGISTLATVILVFILSIRIRKREIETIRKIGGSRRRVITILGAEVSMVAVSSLLIAGGLTLLVSRFGHLLITIIIG